MMISHRVAARLLAGAAPFALLFAAPAHAQDAAALADLKAQIDSLKADQATAAQRIAQLEAALARAGTATAATTTTPSVPGDSGVSGDSRVAAAQAAQAAQAASQTRPGNPAVAFAGTQSQSSPASPINAAGGSSPGLTPVAASRLALSGDLRLRYESNTGDQDARNRDRLVMRGRLRGAYTVNKWLTIGGQLSTGDPNDPNSTDITLTGFDNDLQVSLEQAYFRGTFGNLTVTGGKVPQGFVRTEMVWDGDIAPEGVIASYRTDFGGGAVLRTHGMYYVIDEAPTAEDSHMIGGQLQFEETLGALRFEVAPSYYDYRLSSVAGADGGDFRTNRMANGRYLSDFNLLDIVGAINYTGFGARWPVRIVADYVHNFGATTSEDSGFGIDLLYGRGQQHKDWRFGYGYAQTGVDAVFAAFSHDNTDLATNYIQHSLFAEYVVAPSVILNATLFHYKPKSPLFTTGFLPNDWLNRLRLNMLVTF